MMYLSKYLCDFDKNIHHWKVERKQNLKKMHLETQFEALVMLRRYKNCDEIGVSIKMRILNLLMSSHLAGSCFNHLCNVWIGAIEILLSRKVTQILVEELAIIPTTSACEV